MAGIITLLTDFGLQDPYGGVMKGAIATLAPTATVIDLTHQIPPQDVAAARFALMSAFPYFPSGTVHTVVVDPGVGTARRAIAIATEASYLVGPDNGVFSGVLTQTTVRAAVALTNPRYWRTPDPSQTFHGRDIFAPVAAHLALGVPLEALGATIAPDTLVSLPLASPQRQGQVWVGHIQAIDHFGNLITNLQVPSTAAGAAVTLAHHTLSLQTTYGAVALGQPVALVGSHGWLEIAVNGGSAHTYFQAEVGTTVTVEMASN
jgi:S-adenosylmethionine hydrolase